MSERQSFHRVKPRERCIIPHEFLCAPSRHLLVMHYPTSTRLCMYVPYGKSVMVVAVKHVA